MNTIAMFLLLQILFITSWKSHVNNKKNKFHTSSHVLLQGGAPQLQGPRCTRIQHGNLKVFFALTMMSVGVWESISLSRDFIKVQDAVVSCFRIIDMISNIDVSSEVGRTLDTVEGSTDYRAAAQELQVPSLDQRANLQRFVFEDTISQG